MNITGSAASWLPNQEDVKSKSKTKRKEETVTVEKPTINVKENVTNLEKIKTELENAYAIVPSKEL